MDNDYDYWGATPYQLKLSNLSRTRIGRFWRYVWYGR
jgi:hypothetical protein